MAGNVREWVYNATDRPDRRLILGAGWTDQMYAFNNDVARSSFDRAPINGVRLAKYEIDSSTTTAMLPIPRRFRDYDTERPVDAARYATLRSQYDYDPTPLDVRVEWRDTTPADWIVERVSYAAAYGGERIPATVYLPRRARPPYQTVVFFPGSNAFYQREYDLVNNEYGTFVVQSGRALIAPEYERMLTRIEPGRPVRIGPSIDYRDVVVAWGKDLRRTMDYLATRSRDVDTSRTAYYGISRGGYVGGIMLAIEPRFKAAILFAAGFNQDEVRPEADPLNFVSRITIPVLMLNGRDRLTPRVNVAAAVLPAARHTAGAQAVRPLRRWACRGGAGHLDRRGVCVAGTGTSGQCGGEAGTHQEMAMPLRVQRRGSPSESGTRARPVRQRARARC